MVAVGRHADALRIRNGGSELPSLRCIRTVPGVRVLMAAGLNGPGTGYLRSIDGWLQYKAPGSETFGLRVAVPADGNYVLEDGEDIDKYLRVQVYADYLVTGSIESPVELADRFAGTIPHDDVTAGEAAAGDVADYSFTIYNAGPGIISQIKAWVDYRDQHTQISDDDATWVKPTSESAALEFADLLPGASHTLYVRRTIVAGSPADPDVLRLFHTSFHAL